jgi:hypothetical protein
LPSLIVAIARAYFDDGIAEGLRPDLYESLYSAGGRKVEYQEPVIAKVLFPCAGRMTPVGGLPNQIGKRQQGDSHDVPSPTR